MSQAVSYEQFCRHYALDPSTSDRRQAYQDYLSGLQVVNASFADSIVSDALHAASNASKGDS